MDAPAPDSYSIPEYGPIFHPLRQRDVLFSYEVKGRSYKSDNLSFGLTLSENVETVGSGKAGHRKVKVYFNPSDPEEAVLIPGPKVINVGLLAIGVFSFFWLFRQIIRSTSTQEHGEWRQE